MSKTLTGTGFVAWFLLYAMLLALSTIFFPQLMNLLAALVSRSNCGYPCTQSLVAFNHFGPLALLLLAMLVATRATIRRCAAISSQFWLVLPIAAFGIIAHSILTLGNFWGINMETLATAPPSPSLIIIALFVFHTLCCFDMEEARGFNGKLGRTRWIGGIPIGKLFAAASLWVIAESLLRQWVTAGGVNSISTRDNYARLHENIFPHISIMQRMDLPLSLLSMIVTSALLLGAIYFPITHRKQEAGPSMS